jgi:hypothetical protein
VAAVPKAVARFLGDFVEGVIGNWGRTDIFLIADQEPAIEIAPRRQAAAEWAAASGSLVLCDLTTADLSEESEEGYGLLQAPPAQVRDLGESMLPSIQMRHGDALRLSVLEANSVTPKVLLQYRRFVLDFLRFCEQSGVELETAGHVDEALVARFAQMHQNGNDSAMGQKLVAGWVCLFPVSGTAGPGS